MEGAKRKASKSKRRRGEMKRVCYETILQSLGWLATVGRRAVVPAQEKKKTEETAQNRERRGKTSERRFAAAGLILAQQRTDALGLEPRAQGLGTRLSSQNR